MFTLSSSRCVTSSLSALTKFSVKDPELFARHCSWYVFATSFRQSETLPHCLVQVEAFRSEIIMPNKHDEELGNMYEGHLLASETYVGGHVEALEAGVFRSDIPTHFKIDPSAAQQVR
jgi:hypothetical protein